MVRRNKMAEEAPAGKTTATRPRFAEHSVVSMRHSVKVSGQTLPTGTKGTIVAAYADGIGYEVEVFESFHAVITLDAGDLVA